MGVRTKIKEGGRPGLGTQEIKSAECEALGRKAEEGEKTSDSWGRIRMQLQVNQSQPNRKDTRKKKYRPAKRHDPAEQGEK